MKPHLSKKGGFIALIAVVMISSALMAAVLGASQDIAVVFDEMNHKQYRINATQAALACLSQVFIELEHDYFYTIAQETYYSDPNCSIISVAPASSANSSGNSYSINKPGLSRTILVKGFAKNTNVAATINARILLNGKNISLVSSDVIF